MIVADILAGLSGARRSAVETSHVDYSGTPGDDLWEGGEGNDSAYGWDGDDRLYGNGGNDMLVGVNGLDRIFGGAGDDRLYGGNGDDYLEGGDGNDILEGNAGADMAVGGAGNDLFTFNSRFDATAGDVFDGGDGVDTLSFDWNHGPLEPVDLTGTTLRGIEIIDAVGTYTQSSVLVSITAQQLDSLTGAIGSFLITTGGSVSFAGGQFGLQVQFLLSAAGNTLNLDAATPLDRRGYFTTSTHGNLGNDDVTGSSMVDYIDGDAGADILRGGDGNDRIVGGLGIDRMYGDGGSDRFLIRRASEVGAGELFDGGAGFDYIEIDSDGMVDLSTATLTSVEGIEEIRGGVRLAIEQLAGLTQLSGRFHLTNAGNLSLSGVNLNGALTLAAGTNVLDLTGIMGRQTGITGNTGADTIYGFENADSIQGLDGDDILEGRDGNDSLAGGYGNDILRGGAGDDVLDGGRGTDRLEGDIGNDTLTVAAFDASPGAVYDGGGGVDTLNASGDISGATILGIERISGSMLTLTTSQMNGFTWYSGSFTLVGAGSVNFAGREIRDFTITTSAAGNSIDISQALNTSQGSRATLTGLGGNDILTGGSGVDFMSGGGGNDTLNGGDGSDELRGGAGQDALYGGAGDDRLNIDLASDSVAGEVYDGGAGVDRLIGGTGANIDLSNSTVTGIEILAAGNAGRFTLTAAQLDQATTLFGQFYVVGGGAISLEGVGIEGDLPFTTIYLSSVGNSVDLRGRLAQFSVVAGNGNDTLIGTASGETLNGAGGDDTLFGNEGDDSLNGGIGTDLLYGGLGNDQFQVDRQTDVVFEFAGEGTDIVIATVGNDLANTILGNSGSNLLIAGGGDDTVRGGGGVDSLFGQDGNDQLFGDAGIDYLVGGIGEDTLDGGANADALYGEDGDDILIGGSDFATDILVGGAGNDILRGNSGLGDYDRMDGGWGDDAYYVDTPDDLTFEIANGGTDTVYATITGAGYYLYANVENLVLGGNTPFGVGNELNNRITGSASTNWLLGGAGDDILNGGGGNDVLFGEAGADTFVFTQGTGGDVIGDFVAGTDRIDLRAYGLSWQTVLNSMQENGGTTAIDLGNGDFIVLNGVASTALSQSDFILSAPAQEKTAVMEDLDRDLFAGLVHDFHTPRVFIDLV